MIDPSNSAQGFRIRDSMRFKRATGGCEESRRNRKAVRGAERGKKGGYLGTGLVAALREDRRRGLVESEVPQKSFKVTAYEDIHSGAQGFFDAGGMCSIEGGERGGLF